MAKPLRDRMPQTAAFIDAMREAFGPDVIDRQIRAGMRGEPAFHASENGLELGTRPKAPENVFRVTPAYVRELMYEPPSKKART